MDFELGPEEQAFEREVEAFLREHASPAVMDAHPEQLSQTVDTPAKRAFMAKLAGRGWLGMSWPKAYGGQEKPGIYDYILTEALSRWGAPQPGKGVGIVGKTIIRHGSERMKREFLPRIMRGEIEFAIGYSEPGAGSDAANMQLRATQVAGRLAPRRPEDLDHLRPFRRLLLARRAHRSGGAEAQGHHAVPDPDGLRRASASAPPGRSATSAPTRCSSTACSRRTSPWWAS